MNLYLTAIALAFGQGSRNIFWAGFIRLSVAVTCATSLSWLFCKNLPLIALTASEWITFVVVMCVIHFAATVTLVLSMGMVRAGYSVFERLLVYLPIPQSKRMIVLLIPECIVALLAILLISWPLFSWAGQQNLEIIFIITAVIIGYLGSLGLLHMLGRKQWVIHLFIGVSMLLGEAFLLRQIIFSQSAWWGFSIVLCMFILASASLLWRSRHYLIESITYQKTVRNPRLYNDRPRFWFIKKMFRTRGQQISFGVTFGLSLAASLALYEHTLLDPSLLALLGAILGAAFISDIRGLSRKEQPAEITVLKGTVHFVSIEAASAFIVGTIALLPLILTLLAGSESIYSSVWTQILLGLSVGFFVSTLVVPEGRNISAQCLANLLAIGLLALPPFFQSPVSASPLFQCVLSGTLLAAAYAIEYHRNPYRWRT